MKIVTSFLLAFFFVNSINSFPNEYTDTGNAEANVLENEGSEQGTENTSLSVTTIPSTTEENTTESENEELKITTEESSITDTEDSTATTEPTSTSIETTTSVPSAISTSIPHISYDVEDLIETKNSLKISKLKSNSNYSDDDGWDVYNNYKWIHINAQTSIPSGAVLGGIDNDGSNLYIIRMKKDDSYLYGKYAVGSYRKEAYVTNGRKEISAKNFEVLTARNYTWCNSETYQVPISTPPICKALHFFFDKYNSYEASDIIVPGTLLTDGRCEIGFGLQAHTYTGNFEVLAFGSCNINEAKTN